MGGRCVTWRCCTGWRLWLGVRRGWCLRGGILRRRESAVALVLACPTCTGNEKWGLALSCSRGTLVAVPDPHPAQWEVHMLGKSLIVGVAAAGLASAAWARPEV